METNPPAADDAPEVTKLAGPCVDPGQDLDAAKLSAAVGSRLAGVPKVAQAKIVGWFEQRVAAGDNQDINGWRFTTKTGIYGTNYVQRALITAVGLGANRPQDAVYPTSEVDAEGKAYSGANKYVMHFDKGQMPPVDGFWSLTM